MDADRIVEKYLGGGGQRPAGPRGIRNRNPGNIRATSVMWRGQIGSDGEFCIFQTVHDGLRALAKLLTTYNDKYGLCTPRAIIGRWAPPNENDTNAYVAAVCVAVNTGPDDWLRLSDEQTLCDLMKGIIRHENGQQPYMDSQIIAAIRDR